MQPVTTGARATDEAIQMTQEQILAAVRQSQEAMVRAVTVWSQGVAKAVPELPSQPPAQKEALLAVFRGYSREPGKT
jgi:hypothetical protein